MADIRKSEDIAKLTRSGDYETWQFRMEVHLQGLGLFSIVDGSEVPPPDPAAATAEEGKEPAPVDWATIREWREYRIRYDMATATIIQALTDELAMKYRDCQLRKDSAVLWKKIKPTTWRR